MKTRLKEVLACILILCMLVTGVFVSDYGVIQVWAEENTSTEVPDFEEEDGYTSEVEDSTTEKTPETESEEEYTTEVEDSTTEETSEIENAERRTTEVDDSITEEISETEEDENTVSEIDEEEVIEILTEANDFLLEQEEKISIYFLNSKRWNEVGAYIYGDKGELLGGFNDTTAESADELGEEWVKVNVSEAPPYSIIFFNKGNDAERAELYLSSAEQVYVTVEKQSYTSKDEAEKAINAPPEESIEEGRYIYFLNSANWGNVGAYIYGDKGEILGGFNDTTAVPAKELGEDWVKVSVSEAPPYSIIFFNKESDSERTELYLPSAENVYVTIVGSSYTSKEDAEKVVEDTATTIYFLNYDGEDKKFDEVWAYAYDDDGDVGFSWPGIKAARAADIGENWWQVEIPANAVLAPFVVIFNGGAGAEQIKDIPISNYEGNYVTAKGDETLYTTQNEAERSVGIINETVIYYLNSEGWQDVAAYVYGDAGEALGGWPGREVEPATELGDAWMKVTVPAKPKFSIIFSNQTEGGDQDAERAELLIENRKMVYVAGCKADRNAAAYGSQEEAELAMGMGDPSKMAVLYFYNSRGWGDINGYVYRKEDGESITVGSGWPGKAAEKDETTGSGENWWKLFVPRIPTKEEPFYVIFNDGLNQTEDILVDGLVNVYIIAAGGTYPTAEEAEEAAAQDAYDDGCEEGPNTDLDGYVVNYTGAGAVLPYVTYEAELANTNAQKLEKATSYRETIQSEASGRQAVQLNNTGDYVEFTLAETANAFVLRYSIPDSVNGEGIDSSLSMYINGSKVKDLRLTSKYAWVYGGYPYNNNPKNEMAHRFFDETRIFLDESLPAGTTVKLQKDAGNNAEYYVIDFLEAEHAGAPLEQPANSLSVTDYGAISNDGNDDRRAFEDCIVAAQEQGKEVWIPAGSFDLTEKEPLEAVGVTIRGAGMWYTNLNGAGAAFKYQGTSKFYDFAMTGVSTMRDDSGDLAGFEGTGNRATNVTIQNIWMEHIKVGVWAANTDRMVIQGCRIRNTYADGINLCSGTNNTTVRNNSLRNTGDDCIAVWPWQADCYGNTIEHNTVQVPTLANGIAIYGGGNNIVDNNYVADIINNGAGIVVGSEFDTAKGYTGEINVKNNVLDRCGSMQTDENYMIGAIWIWSSLQPMTTGYYVYNNQMNDCPQTGFTIECNSELTGLSIQQNTINGAKNAVFEYLNGTGSGKLGNLTVENITGDLIKDEAPNFILTLVDEGVVEKPDEGNKPSEGEKPDENEKPDEGNKPSEGEKPDESEKPDEGNKPSEGEKPVEDNRNESSSNSSSSSSNTVATAIKPRNVTVNLIPVEGFALKEGYTMSQIDLSSDNMLSAELLSKYSGKCMYLAAILGKNFGLTIDMAGVPMAVTDMKISYLLEPGSVITEDFHEIYAIPNTVQMLGFKAIFNFYVGEEYSGKLAYIFALDKFSREYKLAGMMPVNMIGNVAYISDEVTNIVILIEK